MYVNHSLSIISIISDIKAFAVLGSNSFWINAETNTIPCIRVLIRSAVSLRNNDSDFDGIIVVVIGVGPVAIDATIEPILLAPSVTETKNPLSNF